MRPNPMAVVSVQQVNNPTIKGLMEAVDKSKEPEILIVAHGHVDGSGLFLPLASGAPDSTTHQQIDRLLKMSITASLNITDADAKTFSISKADLIALIDLAKARKKSPKKLIEFRGCTLGLNKISLGRFREFFGADKLGAPDVGSFFGSFACGQGNPHFAQHAAAHVGKTYEYPTGSTLFCCIGVDSNDEPQNGHVVATTGNHILSWLYTNFDPNATPPGNSLPVHFLWDDNPKPPPGVTLMNKMRPQPYFPNTKLYEDHIVYSP
jgi:hypothetical protein